MLSISELHLTEINSSNFKKTVSVLCVMPRSLSWYHDMLANTLLELMQMRHFVLRAL